ncbi:MAG: transcriptional activator NhaR [Sandaracinus sp.]
MKWLNYHHLHYFWLVAREGGLGPAAALLRLSRPTLSAQIRALEGALGERLFARKGRRLVLTEVGRVAYRYADQIFALGREMVESVEGRATISRRLDVGITDVLAKLVVARILAPVLALEPPTHLVCHEGTHERLVSRLAAHELDVVIADAPLPPGSAVRAFNHLLGECGITFFASPGHAARKKGFPHSLHGAPILVPIAGAPLRRSIDQWLAAREIVPRIVMESEDSALLKAFGSEGAGIFAAPSLVEREIAAQYRVTVLARVPEIRERFYAISMERRLNHPAVTAIERAVRHDLAALGARRAPRARSER